MAARVLRLPEQSPIDVAGVRWIPVRRPLGVSAFGTNAYRADAGEHLIEPHTEGSSGHEELYVVLAGSARFTVDGETFDAPQGTLVLVTPPSRRVAFAAEANTTVLAVGGPGQGFQVSEWETRWLGESPG